MEIVPGARLVLIMDIYPIKNAALLWLESILSERFGYHWHVSRIPAGLSLVLQGREGRIVFDSLQDNFIQARSDASFAKWDAVNEGWKSILGDELPAPGVACLPSPLIERQGSDHIIHYDILGLIYWMLNRIEEIGRFDLDNHGRFPATASHAYQMGYLERPVVDEWLHILGQVIQRQWSNVLLRKHRFSINVSHDVDNPSRYGFKSWKKILRGVASDVVRRGDFKNAVLAPWVRLNSNSRLHPRDPVNSFEWLMDVSEQHGLTSAFNFICGNTAPRLDADYEPGHLAIRTLMRRIHQRGHEIGLHPSYGTYQSPSLIRAEADRLRAIAAEEAIEQLQWGGRMHYLRWEHPTTLCAWNDAGMAYDSSLGYADLPGFRCGTCFEYPAFDPIAGRLLSLRIRPLIVMESTILAAHCLGLGTRPEGRAKFEQFKQTCRAVSGTYTLLWHNCQFEKMEERVLYERLLSTSTDIEIDTENIKQ